MVDDENEQGHDSQSCLCHLADRIRAMGLHVDFHLTPKASARW